MAFLDGGRCVAHGDSPFFQASEEPSPLAKAPQNATDDGDDAGSEAGDSEDGSDDAEPSKNEPEVRSKERGGGWTAEEKTSKEGAAEEKLETKKRTAIEEAPPLRAHTMNSLPFPSQSRTGWLGRVFSFGGGGRKRAPQVKLDDGSPKMEYSEEHKVRSAGACRLCMSLPALHARCFISADHLPWRLLQSWLPLDPEERKAAIEELQKTTAPPPTTATFGTPAKADGGFDAGGPTTSTPGAGAGPSAGGLSDPMASFEVRALWVAAPLPGDVVSGRASLLSCQRSRLQPPGRARLATMLCSRRSLRMPGGGNEGAGSIYRRQVWRPQGALSSARSRGCCCRSPPVSIGRHPFDSSAPCILVPQPWHCALLSVAHPQRARWRRRRRIGRAAAHACAHGKLGAGALPGLLHDAAARLGRRVGRRRSHFTAQRACDGKRARIL